MSDEKRIILIQTITLNQNIRASKIAKTLISGGYYVIFLGWSRGSKIIDKEHRGKKGNTNGIKSSRGSQGSPFLKNDYFCDGKEEVRSNLTKVE